MTKKDDAKEAAKLLGRRGGLQTLRAHGAEKMKEWGKLGGKFGKLGGRPKGAKSGKAKR